MTSSLGKPEWRARLREARRERSPDSVAAARTAIAQHLLPVVTAGQTWCAYVPMRTEPLDPDLPGRLAARGVRVLLPISEAGEPLIWVEAWRDGTEPRWRRTGIGVREPIGQRLPPSTIDQADVVLVPALAVDARGRRLGRGGGYYDRSLPLATHALTIAVIFDDESVPHLPAEAHDCPVTHVVTPSGGLRHCMC